jgi:hypothetical protein
VVDAQDQDMRTVNGHEQWAMEQVHGLGTVVDEEDQAVRMMSKKICVLWNVFNSVD